MACTLPGPAPACPMETCYVSEGDGHGMVFGLLSAFTVLGLLAVPYAKRVSGSMTAEFWYSARNSQDWWSIALSICATSCGAWLLYTPGEAAFLAGWWGVVGYSVAMMLAPLVMAGLAQKFRDQCPDNCNITDWVGWRYGRVAQVLVSLIFLYYMFIYLVSQLKTMGDMTVKFYGKPAEWGIVPVALFTMVYTMIGGLPASLITDWVQAVATVLCVLVICIALFADVSLTSDDWDRVSKGTDVGFDAFVALCFSIFGAEIFNLAFWQRVYAAKDERQLRIGFLVGGGMASSITFLFGLSGLLLKANDIRQNEACPREGSPISVPAFTFFEFLDLPGTTKFLRILVFLLAVCMIASCADSFQSAIASVVAKETKRANLEDKKALLLGEAIVVVVNIAAMLFALHSAKDVNATSGGLFMKLTELVHMADILMIALVVPLFGGLWPFVTTKGCLLGAAAGFLYILVWGWVEFGTFVAGFSNLTMMCFGVENVKPEGYSPYACGPWYAWRSAMLFTTIPLVTFATTYGVSWMENVYNRLEKLCANADPNRKEVDL